MSEDLCSLWSCRLPTAYTAPSDMKGPGGLGVVYHVVVPPPPLGVLTLPRERVPGAMWDRYSREKSCKKPLPRVKQSHLVGRKRILVPKGVVNEPMGGSATLKMLDYHCSVLEFTSKTSYFLLADRYSQRHAWRRICGMLSVPLGCCAGYRPLPQKCHKPKRAVES